MLASHSTTFSSAATRFSDARTSSPTFAMSPLRPSPSASSNKGCRVSRRLARSRATRAWDPREASASDVAPWPFKISASTSRSDAASCALRSAR